jgi:hypothetical protein
MLIGENWILRNSRCLCASGRRYKHCHGSFHNLELEQERKLASEAQRLKEQGLGRPIASEVTGSERVVTVGSERFAVRTEQTFPGFLGGYIKEVLGRAWFLDQMTKSDTEMHAVALWSSRWERHLTKSAKPGVKIFVSVLGAGRAYLDLAYNLYLLQHNVHLRAQLIHRIKQADQFLGALTETRVAATFVRAGYAVAFEDEGDSTKSHCEYVVTHRDTNATFSVEVKTKHWQRYPIGDSAGLRSVRIATRRLLRDALAKHADHRRIVFIELSMPDSSDRPKWWWIESAFEAIREEEINQIRKGAPTSAAYVVIGNHPYQHHLETADYHSGSVADGMGPTSFRYELRLPLRQALKVREEHADFYALWASIESHGNIPSTFDGSIPAFLSPDAEDRRPKIGNQYSLSRPEGERLGVLVDGFVVSGGQTLSCVYRLDSGEMVLQNHAMTASEMEAYRRHPDTFLGIRKDHRVLSNDFETFDWLFERFKNLPRERLLEKLKECPDFETLRNLSQKELVTEYCLRLDVYSVPSVNEEAK